MFGLNKSVFAEKKDLNVSPMSIVSLNLSTFDTLLDVFCLQRNQA